MSTTKDKEFDYQAHMRENAPDSTKIHCGQGARQERRKVEKTRITIRVDAEIVEQFKQMVPHGRGYQSLINQALQEWLAARGVKELLKEELPSILLKLVSEIQASPGVVST
ncbi:MAG: BrnA antitoxin family protein [Candidatus Poribacteria bacterium]|nr:BrnA antitoxin family protein [Candidatus Poribacteria bacterium]